MSVQSEMDRIKSNIQNTYSVLSDLGADVPSGANSDNLAGSAETVSAVLFKSQDLTDEQKQQARTNIGAANQTDVEQLSEEIANYLPKNQGAENVGMFVAVGSDGKLTLVEPPEGGLSGDVVGNLDESNNILLQGDIANGTYTLNWLRADGTIAAGAGSLIVSAIQTFAITKTLSNCTASGATEIRSGGSATVTITANSGYTLPDSIIVSGASYTWNKSNGQIILSNPTSDVAITVTAKAPVQPVTDTITLMENTSIVTDKGTDRANTTSYSATPFVDLSDIPKPCTLRLTGGRWSYMNTSETGYVRFYIEDTSGTKLAGGYTHPSYMPSGVNMVINDEVGLDVTVTVTSNNIGRVRFTCYTVHNSTPYGDESATLTYTPTE